MRQELEKNAATVLLASYCTHLSTDRMGAFSDPGGLNYSDPRDVLGRYWLSVAAGSALCPVLHYLEVALRNSVYNAVATEHVGCVGEHVNECWLDLPTATTILRNQSPINDYARVQNAKAEIIQNGHSVSAGRLIAELQFGFWSGLFSTHYGNAPGGRQRLWPRLLPLAFPHMPHNDRTRENVADRLQHIRKLRNRVFHHEPLWQRKLGKDMALILETIGWIDPVIQASALEGGKAFEISNSGVGWYRRLAAGFAIRQFPTA